MVFSMAGFSRMLAIPGLWKGETKKFGWRTQHRPYGAATDQAFGATSRRATMPASSGVGGG